MKYYLKGKVIARLLNAGNGHNSRPLFSECLVQKLPHPVGGRESEWHNRASRESKTLHKQETIFRSYTVPLVKYVYLSSLVFHFIFFRMDVQRGRGEDQK